VFAGKNGGYHLKKKKEEVPSPAWRGDIKGALLQLSRAHDRSARIHEKKANITLLLRKKEELIGREASRDVFEAG